MDFMTGLKRTDYCGSFTAKDCGRELSKNIVIALWVMGQSAVGAVFDSLVRIGAVAAALIPQCVQWAIAEQAIKFTFIFYLMARKVFTITILIKTVGIFHMDYLRFAVFFSFGSFSPAASKARGHGPKAAFIRILSMGSKSAFVGRRPTSSAFFRSC